MYLGEITRNVLLALIDAAPKPFLFGGKATDVLNRHYGFDSAVMSAVEEAWEASEDGTGLAKSEETSLLSDSNWESSLSSAHNARLESIRKILITRLGFKADSDVSLRDAAIVRRVVTMVASRAAKLSGCAVAAVLVQTGRAVLGGAKAPPQRKGEEQKIGIGVDGRSDHTIFRSIDVFTIQCWIFHVVVSLSSTRTMRHRCENL